MRTSMKNVAKLSWIVGMALLAVAAGFGFYTTHATPMSDVAHAPAASCNVSGFISSDTTWSPALCDPYIVTGSIIVQPDMTLTIEPGTTVRFTSLKALTVQGALVARGTANSLITFTSNQVNPAKGDWGYIHFTDSSTDAVLDENGNYVSGSILQYTIVEYAGGAGVAENGTVRIEGSTPFIDHTTIRQNNNDGIHFWDDMSDTDVAPLYIQ